MKSLVETKSTSSNVKYKKQVSFQIFESGVQQENVCVKNISHMAFVS
jgi:hypothetical protein